MKIISLTRSVIAIVDASWFDYLNQYRWAADLHCRRWYAVRMSNRKKIYMHREILGGLSHKIDHIHTDDDFGVIDNREENLRLATCQQNSFNQQKRKNCSSLFKGVSWQPERNCWVAQIHPNGQTIPLGRFKCELDAARAYDAAAKKYFGEFANLNFN